MRLIQNVLDIRIMKVTLQTLAKKSGFSITTVSRALAGYPDVNEQTRARIKALADELGYVPNQAARRLQSQQSNTIGLVIPLTDDFSDPFFMELLTGVGRQASTYGYDLLISAHPPGDEEMEAYQRLVSGSRVDGMVLARTHVDDPRIAYLKEVNHPFVVNGRANDDDFPHIDVDGFSSFYMLTEHFIDYGHRDIAYIGCPPDLGYAAARQHGYEAALEAHDIPVHTDFIVDGDLTLPGGVEAAQQLLAMDTRPTAIIAGNDLMALGAIQVCRQRGLTVGEDIAIAGFDDIPLSSHADPPLTTIRQPIREIGYQLVDMLITLIRGEMLDDSQRLIEPELIIRESSGKPLN
jgi:LacI family transcriptional regulator